MTDINKMVDVHKGKLPKRQPITQEKVDSIINALVQGDESQRAIARRFSVSNNTVSQIAKRLREIAE
ncbi:TPA: hypothetical protein NGT37_001038 [Vibrio parahaemolyticus]|nr:hypothetical protein [Vibrio parahaemolyticus]